MECGSYDVIREGDEIILRVDCSGCPFFPSLEDEPRLMAMTVDMLAEVGTVTQIVYVQKRDFEYDEGQASLLLEIAGIYKQLSRQRFAFGMVAKPVCAKWVNQRYVVLQNVLQRVFKSDPVSAYVELKRLLREEQRQIQEGLTSKEGVDCLQAYFKLLQDVIGMLEQTKLLRFAEPYLAGMQPGDRSVYRRIFSPTIRPDFMFTKLMATVPTEGEEIGSYQVGNTEITVFKMPESVQYLYHMVPAEFKLSYEKYELLDAGRNILAEHKPKRTEFVEPERMRMVFSSIGADLLEELASQRNLHLRNSERNELAEILVRYTVGFGLLEVLLQDEKVQDITVNSPMGRIPIFIVHDEFGDCVTNIIPTAPEGESWASKLRMISGRPLDEANPILDTELILPGSRARVSSITEPLNPSGLAYSFRRHRDKPWTLPLFVKSKMINPLAAGVMSFLIDGSRTILVAGTRGSGKTSLLGSVMVELMRRARIITIEDSVAGDSSIVVEKNGKLVRTTVGELIDGIIAEIGAKVIDGREFVRPARLRVYSMDEKGKVSLALVSQCMRHKVTKPIYEVCTASGKQLRVTGDHSLFTLGSELLTPVRAGELQPGDFIVTPRLLTNTQKRMAGLDLIEHAALLRGAFFKGNAIRKFIVDHWSAVRAVAHELKYSKAMPAAWRRSSVLPCEVFANLGARISGETVGVKKKASSSVIPAVLPFTDDFLTVVGLWLADGSYDKNSVIFSVVDKAERGVVCRFAETLGLKPKMHSDGVSLMLNSGILKDVFVNVLELKGNAYTKRVPGWVFGLSKHQVSRVLNGLLSGDGCVGDRELSISLCSRDLLHDASTLLLQFGIVARTTWHENKDKTITLRLGSTSMLRKLQEEIGLLQSHKQTRLQKLCARISTHDTSDVIPFAVHEKRVAVQQLGLNSYDYVNRGYSIGRGMLSAAVDVSPDAFELHHVLANSDIFWDRVVSVERIACQDVYVYDFSVPGHENFVCENILAHNTLELPGEALRKLNYNIQAMKVASAFTRGTTEVGADEGIRTTLRLGDSALFVGEVRSVEAKALYEAMRVGALANVVAGTIHGDSPYGVFDRVVNDLGVPRTSFKATDIIIVANPVRSPDGIHRYRRVTQITEVRKLWEEDPVAEGGFVDLFKYDAQTDQLLPTNDLLRGDSDVIKSIAGQVKEWAGNWDAVWDNIQLRAKMKEAIVNMAAQLKNPDLLEADFYIRANDEFHLVSEAVREEVGTLDSERIFFQWNEWLKRAVKK
ncbi:Flp pilus assembly complex ATPase component TadA [Candidatus Woesearchaeota archaeon]|nr:Flp pilus assembly complex ATPase component TadA [Candidatus Woesearchaeota archaeon]